MRIKIVVDLMFGDSGKGRVVDWLCPHKDHTEGTMVVRYTGGHQVGHTVWDWDNNRKHTFSNFGSGTIKGVPTFYSKHCVVYPIAYLNEYGDVKCYNPKVILDPLTIIATPFDVLANRSDEMYMRNGTCGAGFGTTMRRHEESPYKLYAKDLKCRWVLEEKLQAIHEYYDLTGMHIPEMAKLDYDEMIDDYMHFINHETVEVKEFNRACFSMNTLIFEGAQGVMLDREHGIFPHVTRSYTTSKNVMELLDSLATDKRKLPFDISKYYVIRGYQTRHGNGPMSDQSIELINTEDETNVTNTYQGEFRAAKHDPDMLSYALTSDKAESAKYNYLCGPFQTHLIVTCMDHIKTEDLPEVTETIGQFAKKHHIIDSTMYSNSPKGGFLARI